MPNASGRESGRSPGESSSQQRPGPAVMTDLPTNRGIGLDVRAESGHCSLLPGG